MLCKECGQSIGDGMRFCTQCGATVSVQPEPTAQWDRTDVYGAAESVPRPTQPTSPNSGTTEGFGPSTTRPPTDYATTRLYPEAPEQPGFHDQPTQPVYLDQPTLPGQPPPPVYPETIITPTPPSYQDQPTQQIYPNQFAPPSYPNQPTQPVYPNQSAPPVYPNQPTQPVYPNQPAPSIYPNQPAPPSYSNAPAPPTQRRALPLILAGIGALVVIGGVVAYLLLNRANKAPSILYLASSTPNASVGDRVTFSASATDPNNDKLVYQWTTSAGQLIGDGETITLDTSSVDARTGRTDVKVSVTVSDGRGGTASADRSVTVTLNNLAETGSTGSATPSMIVTLDADQKSVRVGDAVNFTAQVQNREAGELTYEWKTSAGSIQANGSTAALQTSNVQVTGNAKPITVTVTVRDALGLALSQSQTVSVVSNAPANWPPTVRVRASRNSVAQGEDVEITADANDRDGDALTYAWRSSSGQLAGSGPRVTLKTTLIDPGPVEVTATVTDARGEAVTERLTITVTPRPNHPPSVAAIVAERNRVRAGERVALRVRAVDPDGDALNYSWTSSAGAIRANGQTALLDTSRIDSDTEVTVSVAVSDGRGGETTGNISIGVAVERRAPPPDNGPDKPPVQGGGGGGGGGGGSVRSPGPISVSVASEDGDYAIVTLSGRGGTPQATGGSIEITILPNGSGSARGYLPVGSCLMSVGAKDNTQSPGIVERPGPRNDYSTLRVRIRPKDKGKPVRVVINWSGC